MQLVQGGHDDGVLAGHDVLIAQGRGVAVLG